MMWAKSNHAEVGQETRNLQLVADLPNDSNPLPSQWSPAILCVCLLNMWEYGLTQCQASTGQGTLFIPAGWSLTYTVCIVSYYTTRYG